MLIRYCPHCWAELGYEATTCTNCGASLSEEQSYVDRLIAALHHPEPTRAGLALDILSGWLHETRAVEPICALVEHTSDPAMLKQAAHALGRLGERRAVPTLARLLGDPSRPFVARQAAAQALGQLGGAEAFQALTLALADPLASIREAAQRALAEMGHQQPDT